ncbi:capsule biosynthesis protein [Shinella sp. BYT-45]|uniref:capsular polysaccharide export protein, LipB/KpsS family n=1 Tax=Shinella sp. BYT-45 TaxID=3377377 RepID=UPI00397EA95D
MKDTIVFVSLAGNQSSFFAALEPLVRKAGRDVVHVCFHEGSAKELGKAGHRVFNPFELSRNGELPAFEAYDIANPALLIGHEKAAYEISDTEGLLLKFRRHLAAMEKVFDTLVAEGRNIVVVQELGGFTSVLAAYFVARRHAVPNYFIEPSFFKGRFFLTRDSFSAPRIPRGTGGFSEEVRSVLGRIRESQTVVIPVKDRLHYRGAFHKLTDPKNWRRLFEKLVEKHLLKHQEEFQHIGGHVRRHVRMSMNAAKLRKFYAEIPAGSPFIYYPLHVPADFALTIRSPEYLDQLSLIDFLCRVAPIGRKVVVKEHPALIGALPAGRMSGLLRRHDNLVLLSPAINNHSVLRQAEAVVTVNSKAGAEALLYRRPVLALGDSFYRDSGLVTAIDALRDLPARLSDAVPPSEEEVNRFLQDVWSASVPGELYDVQERNVAEFAGSLLGVLRAGQGSGGAG